MRVRKGFARTRCAKYTELRWTKFQVNAHGMVLFAGATDEEPSGSPKISATSPEEARRVAQVPDGSRWAGEGRVSPDALWAIQRTAAAAETALEHQGGQNFEIGEKRLLGQELRRPRRELVLGISA